MDESRPEERATEQAVQHATDRAAPASATAPAPPFPARQLADRPLTEPHRDRLSQDDPAYPQIIRAHGDALEAGADSYLDPRTGFTVLTAAYLARRGTCCESGCRHCPYFS